MQERPISWPLIQQAPDNFREHLCSKLVSWASAKRTLRKVDAITQAQLRWRFPSRRSSTTMTSPTKSALSQVDSPRFDLPLPGSVTDKRVFRPERRVSSTNRVLTLLGGCGKRVF